MSKQSIAEFIGEKIGNYDQDKSNRIGDVDIIVGKSNSERSRIKDQTVGESYIKSGLGFPVLGLFGLNSISAVFKSMFEGDIDKLNTSEVLEAEAVINNARESVTFSDNASLYLQNKGSEILDYAVITENEWLANENSAKLAEHVGDLLQSNITASDLYSSMMVLSTVATYSLAKYISGRKERLTEEEQIAKYSDSERVDSEGVRALLNDQMSFNISLGFAKSLNSQGHKAAISLSILRGIDKVLSIPRNSLNAIAETVLQNEEDKNFFQKSLTTVYEKFFGNKELLGQHLKKDKMLNGTPLHNAIETINEVKRQAKDKQSGLSADSYTFEGNVNTIKTDAMQQKIKNHILESLKKAVQVINNNDKISIENKDVKKAKKVLKRIKELHNKKVEQKFDHYEAISHLANDILNGNINLNGTNLDIQITEILSEKSFDLSYGHFEKDFEPLKKLCLNSSLTSNQEKNLDKSIKTILKNSKDKIYNENGVNKVEISNVKNEISLFFAKHPKYLNSSFNSKEVAEMIADKAMVFYQDNSNRNIQAFSGTYIEYIEKRLELNEVFLKNKDLNNDNTYAVNNNINPKKIKI